MAFLVNAFSMIQKIVIKTHLSNKLIKNGIKMRKFILLYLRGIVSNNIVPCSVVKFPFNK